MIAFFLNIYIDQDITIYGTSFGSSRGSVYIGAVEATIRSWSDTEILITIPSLNPGDYELNVKTGSFGCAGNR